ncbi:peptidase inhibitor family I36 protein [Streptomyces sp. 796.1]|uniref:peptidase inhibitor family I36 protein n=1 Tax=Streptomyces sp. 796.1 TaxID=3163029 RepID=UPI0039C8DFDE
MSRTILTVAAVAAVALAGMPSLAVADDGRGSAKEPVVAADVSAKADGYLYAFEHINKGGKSARWASNSWNWGLDRDFNDKASSLHNNGFPGSLDDVIVYRDADFKGNSRGVHNGVYLADLRKWNFDGTNVPLQDRISSHRWVNL